jgi:hypothetical protein
MTQHPVFETTRLILRDITERDAPAYEKHFIDYDVIGTMRYCAVALPRKWCS